MSAVKCFFSGVEGRQHYEACLNAGVRHVLTSFLYLKKKGDMGIVRRRKRKNPEIQFMIDSGAHTFITDYGKYQSWTKQDFENYVKEYTKWLYENREFIFCGVELDIDYALNMLFGGGAGSTVGTSMVERWQQQYFMPLQAKGVEICYVWHTERKLEGWEAMCSKFGYVGLPGEMSSEPDFNKYMAIARRYCTRVHGFAATKQADFRDWPWYSVDSITWKTCEMYGTLIHWDGHKQILYFDQDKANRVKYRRDFERLGLDADGIINDTNYKEVTKYALHSMRGMEAFYEQRFKDRLFYYDLRMPHPKAVLTTVKIPELREYWRRCRPDTLFKHHAKEADLRKIRTFLAALAAVQSKDYATLNSLPEGLKFLADYFPKLVTPQLAEESLFQKEIAAYLAPAAPPALRRTEPAHYLPTNNPAKPRELPVLSADDLEWAMDFEGPL